MKPNLVKLHPNFAKIKPILVSMSTQKKWWILPSVNAALVINVDWIPCIIFQTTCRDLLHSQIKSYRFVIQSISKVASSMVVFNFMSCSHKKIKMKILEIRFIFLCISKTRNHFRDKPHDDGKCEEKNR